jgi:hypothetical protein
MQKETSQDLYCCLTSLEIGQSPFELGYGITLSSSYVHVMSHTMLAVKRPEQTGQHHPGPWLATGDGFGFDSNVVLHIPDTYKRKGMKSIEVAMQIAALLRLWVDPRIRLTLISTGHPCEITTPDSGPRVHVANAMEIQPWYFQLCPTTERDTMEDLLWIREHWENALELTQRSAAFSLGLEAIANAQLIHSPALGIVSVWAALESLFTGSTTELRFRVSAMIAAYLKPLGPDRVAEHKRVLKLYDARSAAAHGAPKHTRDDLLASLELLRKVLISMIHQNKVPTKEDLESLLFGAT